MSLKTSDENEIKLFDSISNEWWDEDGSMSFLHSMSEVRTNFIKLELIEHFNIKRKNNIFKGLDILDLGCGGGIASEPLFRLGANLTGIDESQKLIDVAKFHAKAMKLKINYKCMSIDNLNAEPSFGSHFFHNLTNLRVGYLTQDKKNKSIEVTSRFHMVEYRLDQQRYFGGKYTHKLLETDVGYKIKQQRVDLANVEGPFDFVMQVWL